MKLFVKEGKTVREATEAEIESTRRSQKTVSNIKNKIEMHKKEIMYLEATIQDRQNKCKHPVLCQTIPDFFGDQDVFCACCGKFIESW